MKENITKTLVVIVTEIETEKEKEIKKEDGADQGIGIVTEKDGTKMNAMVIEIKVAEVIEIMTGEDEVEVQVERIEEKPITEDEYNFHSF